MSPTAAAAKPRHRQHDDDDDDKDDHDRLTLAVAPSPLPLSPSPSPLPLGATTPTLTMTTTLDAALSKHVGELGPAQMRLCLMSSLSWASMAMAVLSLVFLTPDPVHSGAWSCVAAAAATGVSAEDGTACAALKARQQQQRQPPQAQPLTAQSPKFCALPRDSWRWTDPRASAVATFDLQCARAPLATATSSALFLGFMAASPAWGSLADCAGRRAAALASGWAAAAASLLTAVAPTLPLLLVSRFLLGVGVAGLPVSAYPLSVESVGPRARGKAGILSQAVYHIGEWLLPLCAFLLDDWRHLCLAVAAASALTTLLLHSVPESPRWLMVRGREAEARSVLDALARGNGKTEGLPPRLRLGVLSERPGALGASNNNNANTNTNENGLSSLWRHRRSRAFLLAASVATGVSAAGFYVCNLVDALPGALAWTFFVTSAAELPFALGLAYLIDAWGRKPAVAALLLGGGVCGALLPRASSPAAQLLAATVAKGAISAAWGGLVTWSAEMFSTSLRATALGFSNQAARLGGVVAPIIVHASAARGWPEGQFFVAGVASALSALLVWWTLPETRGAPQPDSLEDVDAIFCGGGGGCGGAMAAGATTPVRQQRPWSSAAAAATAEKTTALVSAPPSASSAGRPATGDSGRTGGWAPLLATGSPARTAEMEAAGRAAAEAAAAAVAGGGAL
jgi:MFS family permease